MKHKDFLEQGKFLPQVEDQDYQKFAKATEATEADNCLEEYVSTHTEIPSTQDALRLMLIAAIRHNDASTAGWILNGDTEDLPDDLLTTPDSSGYNALSLALSIVRTIEITGVIFGYIDNNKDNFHKVELDSFNLDVMRSKGVYGGEYSYVNQTIKDFLEPVYEGENYLELVGYLEFFTH